MTQDAHRPSVVFEPDLLQGVNAIANLVKPTLGPLARTVAIERMNRDRAPELLDDAGTLARRVVQLAHPTHDVGAMLLRNALWSMRETMGDGAATTAVLTQSMLQHATKAVAAGANAMLVRRGIEAGIAAACDAIQKNSVPTHGSKRNRNLLGALVRSQCSDEELVDKLIEAVSFGGADAYIDVGNHEPRRIDRDYVEGSLFETGWHNANFATDAGRTITRLDDAAVVLVDNAIESAAHAVEGLKRLNALGIGTAAIMVANVSEDAMSIFNMTHHNGMMKLALLKPPGIEANRAVQLQDVAALTGARVLFGDGAAFAHVRADDLGFVRRLWAKADKLSLIGGHRDALALRRSIKMLRSEIANLRELARLPELRKRLGRLTSSWIMLRVGGVTNDHAQTRQDQARRMVQTIQSATRGGVVAGGGAALLVAATKMQPFTHSSMDVAMGYTCVVRALEAPLRAIAENAGADPSPIVVDVLRCGSPFGFDAVNKRIVNMLDAGIVDATEIVLRALRTAGSTAALAITTDAVVHHKNPQIVPTT